MPLDSETTGAAPSALATSRVAKAPSLPEAVNLGKKQRGKRLFTVFPVYQQAFLLFLAQIPLGPQRLPKGC